MKSKGIQPKSIIQKIKDTWSLILFGGVILFFLFIFLKGELRSYLLKNYSVKTKAVIINKKNYFGNSPVSHDFSYSYEFEINNEKYTADSQNKTFNIGDSVWIEYYPRFPSFSRITTRKK